MRSNRFNLTVSISAYVNRQYSGRGSQKPCSRGGRSAENDLRSGKECVPQRGIFLGCLCLGQLLDSLVAPAPPVSFPFRTDFTFFFTWARQKMWKGITSLRVSVPSINAVVRALKLRSVNPFFFLKIIVFGLDTYGLNWLFPLCAIILLFTIWLS